MSSLYYVYVNNSRWNISYNDTIYINEHINKRISNCSSKKEWSALDCTNLFPSRATKNLEYYLSSHIVTYQAYKTMLDGKELSPSS